eukprot:gene7074-14388_t
MRLPLKIALIFVIFKKCVATSPIGYDAIFTLVVLELVFAFGVGVSCILFSINLIRALGDSPSQSYQNLSDGSFPRSRQPSAYDNETAIGYHHLATPTHIVNSSSGAIDYNTFIPDYLHTNIPNNYPQANGFLDKSPESYMEEESPQSISEYSETNRRSGHRSFLDVFMEYIW